MIHLVTEPAIHLSHRLLGRVVGSGEKNRGTVVFFAGLHGNEPAGIQALQRLMQQLPSLREKLAGEVVCLAGNLGALSTGKRFIAQDLNRVWTAANVDRARNRTLPLDPGVPEFVEQRDLLTLIDPLLESARQPLYFIDLHTTSAPSVPFIVINDQLSNRRFALKFPVPTVLGLEEFLEGPLLSYLNQSGHVAMAFEAGQHDDIRSIDLHESFVWAALVRARLVEAVDVPGYATHARRLAQAAASVQGIFEVIHRHAIDEGDQFSMRVGYLNFAPLLKHEAVASDHSGPITVDRACRIFMPLYQAAGTDGFFLVKQIPRWALALSALLRRVNFERLLLLLPGVTRSPEHPDTLVVNRKIARFLAKELFHLLGYRRKKGNDDYLMFSRREIIGEAPHRRK